MRNKITWRCKSPKTTEQSDVIAIDRGGSLRTLYREEGKCVPGRGNYAKTHVTQDERS